MEAEARDASGLYASQRPTFHDIRGLGGRLCKAQGMFEAAIQSLKTHSNPRTTAICLDEGAQALADGDYVPVSAPLSLRGILGQRGQRGQIKFVPEELISPSRNRSNRLNEQ
jgi:hypothetical protein